MAIEEVFYADPRLSGAASFVGGYGQAKEDRRRYDDRFNESQREFDVRTALELEAQAMQERMRNDALAQQAYQQAGDLQFRYAATQAELQQQSARDQMYAQNQAADIQQRNLGQMAQAANAREGRKFQMAISQQDAIIEARQKNLIDDAQYAEAQQRWSQNTGLDWNAPQQMAAENERRVQQQTLSSMEQASLDPFTGQPLMSAQQIQAWLDSGVTPDKIMGNITKLQSEARQRQALELKATETETKEKQSLAKIETDRALAAEQNQRKWQEADENQEQRRIAADQDREIARAKAVTDGLLRIANAEAEWDLNYSDPKPAKPGETAPPTPKRPDFDALRQRLLQGVNSAMQTPTAAPTAGAQPTTGPIKISSKAEYDALPSGKNIQYIAPDGSTRTKP